MSLDESIARVAALHDPVRRALYLHVASRGAPVGRDEAARATGISRALAAFHLDRLVAAGLLAASYRRLSGRRGPGAGRPAKLYQLAPRQIELTIPPRRYEVAARLFAEAVAVGGRATAAALRRVASAFGRALGTGARERAGPRPSRARLLDAATQVLCDYGFEPERVDGTIRLRNCPFDALARERRAIVCGMNLALVRGLVRGLRDPGVRARLEPRPGMCCVVLR